MPACVRGLMLFFLKINEIHRIKFSMSFKFIYFPASFICLPATKNIKYSAHLMVTGLHFQVFIPNCKRETWGHNIDSRTQ